MIALDTSVIVAALLSWHERHEAAARAVARALRTPGTLVIPSHALVESYAVMTRLPAPHRLTASDALELLRENFRDVRVAALASREVWPFLSRVAEAKISGGRTYDALILESARDAGATRLLTLNARDFERFDAGLEVVEP